jgi:hypothetical protein
MSCSSAPSAIRSRKPSMEPKTEKPRPVRVRGFSWKVELLSRKEVEIMKHNKSAQDKMAAQNEEFIKRIQDADRELERIHRALLPTYQKALVWSSRDPGSLTRSLSERYPKLRVAFSYENGSPSVSATPIFQPFELEAGQLQGSHSLEHLARKAEDFLKQVVTH